MVVLDQFYQIVERNTDSVSPLWKVFHTFLCFVTALSGFLTAFCFGRLLDDFGYNCILDAQLVFESNTTLNATKYRINKVQPIDLTESIWGSQSSCNFAQFIPLIIMISAIMWGIYFAMMSKGGAGYQTDVLSRPWSIVYPCIFFTFIFFVIYIISTERLKRGLESFCDQFNVQFNNTDCVPQIEVYTNQFHEDRNVLFFDFYHNFLITIISAQVGMWSWVCQFIFCILRVCCVADFDLQLVTIKSKEEEVVEKIVEFADTDEVDEDV